MSSINTWKFENMDECEKLHFVPIILLLHCEQSHELIHCGENEQLDYCKWEKMATHQNGLLPC